MFYLITLFKIIQFKQVNSRYKNKTFVLSLFYYIEIELLLL